MLGPEHPVARASHWRDIFIRQITMTSGVLALAIATATSEPGRKAVAFASCALIVESWLIAATVISTMLLHERARDVIADGGSGWDVAEVADVCERLTRRSSRERLARRLERALRQAEHWHETPISTRPPNGVRQLAMHRVAAIEIARLVREPTANVRGVALLDRLIRDGYASSLYTGPPQTLAEELRRIQFLLS